MIVFGFIVFPSIASAQLKAMDENSLKSSIAQAGLTTFTMSNNTAQLFLDIHIETYTTINNFSAGYHLLNPTDPAKGWDNQWNTIKLGNSTSDPLIIDGLMLVADFDSTNPTKLQRVVFGSNYLNGTLSANMTSYTGCYNPGLIAGGTYDTTPVAVADRSNLGPTSFNFASNATQNMGLFFIMDMSGSKPSFQVVSGYDSKTLTTSNPVWWKSP